MSSRSRQSGASLITVIFLIAILVPLGVTMYTLSTVQHDTVSKSLLAARVYYGAKAGIEWGVQRAISDPAPPARCSSFSGGATLLPVGAGLETVSVSVACVPTQHGSGSASYVYYITAVATTGSVGSPSYAERRMEATVSNIP